MFDKAFEATFGALLGCVVFVVMLFATILVIGALLR